MIATPDHWHTKIAVEAMQAGKDVYCEKPLTLTIDEGKLIEKVVKETGRVFQVGTMQRTEIDQRFLKAIALIRDGRIGTVKKVTCGIDRMESSPVIPAVAAPEGLDWDFWLGPAPKVPYRALPELREGYGGGVPLYSNCHYSFRNWHEYSGGKLTDWGAHHVDIACWALGATDTGPSKITPVDYKLPVEYKDGNPMVDDRYNAATQFTIRVDMPNDVELIITSEGDNGILFEGTEGRFFVNRGKITGKPVEDLKDNPLPEGAIEKVYGGKVSANHTANFIEGMKARKQPISDVWSHNRMLEICHLSNIAMRLGRELKWDPVKREIVGDAQANSFLARKTARGLRSICSASSLTCISQPRTVRRELRKWTRRIFSFSISSASRAARCCSVAAFHTESASPARRKLAYRVPARRSVCCLHILHRSDCTIWSSPA